MSGSVKRLFKRLNVTCLSAQRVTLKELKRAVCHDIPLQEPHHLFLSVSYFICLSFYVLIYQFVFCGIRTCWSAALGSPRSAL